MDPDVQAYLDGLDPVQRAMFDRIHALIVAVRPDVEVGWAYKMPTFRTPERALHVAAWKHGISFYGWRDDADDGFSARHPDLSSGRGTLRLRPADAEAIDDAELTGFLRATFAP